METKLTANQEKRRVGRLLGALLLTAVLLLVAYAAATTQDDSVVFELEEIAMLEEMLEGDLDPLYRQSLEQKLAGARYSATAYAESKADPVDPADLARPEFSVVTDPPFPTGIFVGDETNISRRVARIENRWQGVLDSANVTVFAGALTEKPEQGVVYVLVDLPAQRRSYFDSYLTPSQSGSVHVVSESNGRLVLLTATRTRFYFDIPGRQFVKSARTVVPTVTPRPPHPNEIDPYPSP